MSVEGGKNSVCMGCRYTCYVTVTKDSYQLEIAVTVRILLSAKE